MSMQRNTNRGGRAAGSGILALILSIPAVAGCLDYPPCEYDPGPSIEQAGYLLYELNDEHRHCSAAVVYSQEYVISSGHCAFRDHPYQFWRPGAGETPAQVVWIDPVYDVALWRLEQPADVEPLQFADDYDVREPLEVYAGGCRKNEFGARPPFAGGEDWQRVPEESVCVCPGDSGGPVLNEDGELVMIVEGRALRSYGNFSRFARVHGARLWLEGWR